MNGTLLGQTKGSDTIVFLYDEKANRYGFDYNGTKYYYIFNVQGDVIGILNQAGQKIVSYTYDPWGKVLSVDGSEASTIGQLNPIRYRGYYYDTETGFYYLQSRYYDPEVRRWINSDGYISSIGGDIRGYNMFAYCMNNPVTLSDNTGNWPFFAVTAVIGAVVGAVAGGVVAANNGGNIWAGIGIGAAAGALIGTGFGMGAGAALAGSITASTGAVMAGGSALVGTVATGGLGAGVTYVANNFRSSYSGASQTIATACTSIQTYYPPNNGFSGIPQNTILSAGTIIQRTGDLSGRFVAPAYTPPQILSMPFDKLSAPTTLFELQKPIQALSGRVAPWFGQMGGGTQYLLTDSVKQLLEDGVIKIFGG